MLSTRMFFWWGQEAETPPVVIPPSTATGLEDPCTEVEELIDLLELHNAENLELSNGDVLELVYSLNWIGSCDDATGEQVQGHVTLGGRRSTEWPGSDYWVFIDGIRTPGVTISSVSGGRDLGQRGTLRFTMIRTAETSFDIPVIGQTVQLSWQDHLQWGGMIENVRVINRNGTHDTVLTIQVDCASWERVAEKRLTANTYSNQTTQDIFLDLLTDYLSDEGIVAGVIDEGPALTLAGPKEAGGYIRVSEFLRDVAEASGGVHDIDPFKRLNFFKDTVGEGGLILRNVVAIQEAESTTERQDYRNVQTVSVRGTGSTVVEFSREDDAEIAARQAIEGGTGRYEAAERISHPSSDDAGECGRLAVSMCVVRLAGFGRHARALNVRMNLPKYRLGDIVQAYMLEHNASGTYQCAGLRFRPIQDRMFVDLTLIQTSVLQRAFQAWMKIAASGRALVQVPSTPLFTNVVTFLASTTWPVPNANGDGSDVEVEFDVFGPGGGGTASFAANGGPGPYGFQCGEAIFFPGVAPGYAGDAGGKAISFRSLPVGTIVTITIGTAGVAGAPYDCTAMEGNQFAPYPAGSGTVCKIEIDGVLIAQANGGGGGFTGVGPGGAIGDLTTVGGGAAGGAGGEVPFGAGSNGGAASVQVRY